MTCLFCKDGDSFNTVEHIVPESMGNDDLLLAGQVCDKCQNYLSQNERYILSETPIGFWRVFLGIKTKKRRLPAADFTKSEDKRGAIPDYHPAHDNFTLEAQSDFSVELKPEKDISNYFDSTGKGQIKYVFTPKVLYEIGRFLGKIGLELICLHNELVAHSTEFDNIRRYVRRGSTNDHWPIFHTTQGAIKDLFNYMEDGDTIKEDVVCYSYRLLEVAPYVIFNFVVGTDSWVICLNDRYPTPAILSAFSGQKLELMWYTNGKKP